MSAIHNEITSIETVSAHQNIQVGIGIEYYVKWTGLPYSECTWEDGTLLQKLYPESIKKYEMRINNNRAPVKSSAVRLLLFFPRTQFQIVQVLKRRPRFAPMLEQPEFLAAGQEGYELRDYQLNGVNWMLRAWCK